MKLFEKIAQEVAALVTEKDKAYGSAFDKAGEFLAQLFPNGIQPSQYSDMLCLVRIFDKMMRIATNKDAFGESPFRDIVGYGLLGVRRDEERKKLNEPKAATGCNKTCNQKRRYEDTADRRDYLIERRRAHEAVIGKTLKIDHYPAYGPNPVLSETPTVPSPSSDWHSEDVIRQIAENDVKLCIPSQAKLMGEHSEAYSRAYDIAKCRAATTESDKKCKDPVLCSNLTCPCKKRKSEERVMTCPFNVKNCFCLGDR